MLVVFSCCHVICYRTQIRWLTYTHMCCIFILQIMLSGRSICPPEWGDAYSGWLMSAARSGSAQTKVIGSNICVDKNAVTRSGLSDDSAIKLSHIRFGSSCGSTGITCDQYTGLRNIPCVVCAR